MIKGKVIAIDFDGTITEHSQYPKMGELRSHCKEAINYISQHNEVYLWTCRTGYFLEEAKEFLQKHKIEIKFPKENISKLNADLYIDDRNYPRKKIDWYEIEKWFKTNEI